METLQGCEYPRTPFPRYIGAAAVKLEQMVFNAAAIQKQKRFLEARTEAVKRSGTARWARVFSHAVNPTIFSRKKKDKKTLFLSLPIFHKSPNVDRRDPNKNYYNYFSYFYNCFHDSNLVFFLISVHKFKYLIINVD